MLLSLLVLGVMPLIAKHETVIVNIGEIMQHSPQGRELQTRFQKEADSINASHQSQEKALSKDIELLNKKAPLMNEESYITSLEDLQYRQQRLQRQKREDAEDFDRYTKRSQEALIREIRTIISQLVIEKEWGIVLDSNMPGVIAVAEERNVTDEVLHRLTQQYVQQGEEHQEKEISEE